MAREQHDHPLARVLNDAAAGRFPPIDGSVEVLPCDPWGTSAVVEFTGHSYVLTDVFAGLAAGAVAGFDLDGFGGATRPAFLLHLAGPGGSIGSLDAVLVRRGGGGVSTLADLADVGVLADHPRVRRARHHRRDVRVVGDERGFVTVGSGVVGRTEVSIELTGAAGSTGAGRDLLMAAVAALPVEIAVFAQVAPGNAASLRMFLACGFVPIGSEVLIERPGSGAG